MARIQREIIPRLPSPIPRSPQGTARTGIEVRTANCELPGPAIIALPRGLVILHDARHVLAGLVRSSSDLQNDAVSTDAQSIEEGVWV